MYGFLIFMFVIICLALSIVILLQSSKGGGLAGAFGGGGDMGTVFGGRGAATFLSRVTTGLAVAFLGMALLLSFLNRGKTAGTSLVQQEQQRRAAEPGSGLPVVQTGNSDVLLPIQSGDLKTAPVADSTQ